MGCRVELGPLGPLGAHPELATHARKSTPRAGCSAPRGGGSQIWGQELGRGSPPQGFSSVTAPARLPNLLVCRCTQAPPSRPRPRAPALACLPLDPWSWGPWVLSTPFPRGHTVPGTQGRRRYSAPLPGTCGRSQPCRGGSGRDHKRGPCRGQGPGAASTPRGPQLLPTPQLPSSHPGPSARPPALSRQRPQKQTQWGCRRPQAPAG